jgi:uncharacterized RDD family membrane protein YckC
MTYAGFWKRFAAFLIDSIILSIVCFVLFIPFLGLLGLGVLDASLNEDDPSGGFVIALITAYVGTILAVTIASWLYYALMEASHFQATPGKMALGIVVTDLNGNRVSFGRATGRYFGFIIAAFTERKQALHDIIASCLVINKS